MTEQRGQHKRMACQNADTPFFAPPIFVSVLRQESATWHISFTNDALLCYHQTERPVVKCLVTQRFFNTNAGRFFNQLLIEKQIDEL